MVNGSKLAYYMALGAGFSLVTYEFHALYHEFKNDDNTNKAPPMNSLNIIPFAIKCLYNSRLDPDMQRSCNHMFSLTKASITGALGGAAVYVFSSIFNRNR